MENGIMFKRLFKTTTKINKKGCSIKKIGNDIKFFVYVNGGCIGTTGSLELHLPTRHNKNIVVFCDWVFRNYDEKNESFEIELDFAEDINATLTDDLTGDIVERLLSKNEIAIVEDFVNANSFEMFSDFIELEEQQFLFI